MGGEWPLVAFTILGQTAVGIYFFIGGPLFLSGGTPAGGGALGVRLILVLTVLALMAAATGLAFFHLQHPARAYKIFSNLKSSWLSREILFELAFVGLAGSLGFCEWRRVGGAGFLKALFVLGGLAGVLFLVTMSKLYMLPAVPAWNRPSTPVSFVLTSVVLGIIAATVFFGLLPEPPAYYRPLLIGALVSVAASLVSEVLLAPGRGVFGARAEPSLRPPGRGPFFLHAARLSALLAGAVLIAVALVVREGRVPGVLAPPPAVLLAMFFLAAAAEVSGRFLFYFLVGSDQSNTLKKI